MLKTTYTLLLITLAITAMHFSATANDVQDSLILNDGKVITGKIEQKSLDTYQRMQADINTGNTFIDEGSDGKATKVSNKDVHYFVLAGVRYVNHKVSTGGNRIMKVIQEGKGSLYNWSGQAGIVSEKTRQSGMFQVHSTQSSMHDLSEYVLVVKGKDYNPTAKYVEKHFDDFFGDCPKLIKESKAADFDFSQIESIVKEYNGCK